MHGFGNILTKTFFSFLSICIYWWLWSHHKTN